MGTIRATLEQRQATRPFAGHATPGLRHRECPRRLRICSPPGSSSSTNSPLCASRYFRQPVRPAPIFRRAISPASFLPRVEQPSRGLGATIAMFLPGCLLKRSNPHHDRRTVSKNRRSPGLACPMLPLESGLRVFFSSGIRLGACCYRGHAYRRARKIDTLTRTRHEACTSLGRELP